MMRQTQPNPQGPAARSEDAAGSDLQARIQKELDQAKSRQQRELNRIITKCWAVIIACFLVSYLFEVLKGLRSAGYFACFCATMLIPFAVCMLHNRRRPDDRHYGTWVTCGYFIMYAFALITGNTVMVFSYILPMLSFMVLLHSPHTIQGAAAAAIALNLASVCLRFCNGELNHANSQEAEIQMALIVFCFAGAWMSSNLYERIIVSNEKAMATALLQENTIEGLETEVMVDKLTGIGNRTAYDQAVEEIARSGSQAGVIFCDVNGLKYCNDHKGHAAGDQLLRNVADRLTVYFRHSNCYRIGGDEFIVLVPDLDQDTFTVRAAGLKENIWEDRVPLCSVGYDHTVADLSEAIKNAEARMYNDKKRFYEKFPEYKRG